MRIGFVFFVVLFAHLSLAENNINDFYLSEEENEKIYQEIYLDPFTKEWMSPSSSQKALLEANYNVTGAYTSFVSPQCHFSELSKNMNQLYSLTSDLAKSLQNWVNTCEAELSRFQTSSIVSLLTFGSIRYPLSQNQKLQPVLFNYDFPNLKVRGILGIKDNKKRPLLIVRNGVYGNAEESSVSKMYFMHLLDESPFHVLFLGNVTGEQYIRDNGILSMGGFDEGRQYLEIAKQMMSSSYKDLIEDIHVMGLSLGGNGALFSSLYNSYQDVPLIKSVTAICPVVNLENSLNNVFSNSPVGKLYTIITYKLLQDIFSVVPILSELLTSDRTWSQAQISEAVKQSSIRYYQRRTQSVPWDYAPFVGTQVRDERSFWELNNFLNYTDQIKTPTLVIHAQDDFIVESKKNADLLFNKIQNENSNIGVVKFKNGSHCAFSVANGWPTMSTLLRDFVLKHSSYNEVRNEILEPIVTSPTIKPNRNLTLARYEWEAELNKPEVTLKLTYHDKTKRDSKGRLTCRNEDFRFSDATFCYSRKEVKIHLSYFKKLNVFVPQSLFEKNNLTRWLNTHVTPVSDRYENLLGTQNSPKYFKSLRVLD